MSSRLTTLCSKITPSDGVAQESHYLKHVFWSLIPFSTKMNYNSLERRLTPDLGEEQKQIGTSCPSTEQGHRQRLLGWCQKHFGSTCMGSRLPKIRQSEHQKEEHLQHEIRSNVFKSRSLKRLTENKTASSIIFARCHLCKIFKSLLENNQKAKTSSSILPSTRTVPLGIQIQTRERLFCIEIF